MSFDAGAVIGRMELVHDQVGKALAEVKAQMGQLQQSTNQATGGMSAAFGKVTGAIEYIGRAWAEIAIVKKIVEFGFNAVREFDAAEQATKRADARLREYGTTWDELGPKLETATGGAVDDMDLLANTILGMQRGLNPDQIVKLMELARTEARQLGVDFQQVYDGLTMSVARSSDRMLAQYGIQLDLKKAEEEFARSIGTTADRLNEKGKQQAFINALMAKANEETAKYGATSRSLSENIKVILRVGGDLVKALGGWIDKYAGIRDATKFWADESYKLLDILSRVFKQATLNNSIPQGRQVAANEARIKEIDADLMELNTQQQDPNAIRWRSKQYYDDQAKRLRDEKTGLEAENNVLRQKIFKALEDQNAPAPKAPTGGNDQYISSGKAEGADEAARKAQAAREMLASMEERYAESEFGRLEQEKDEKLRILEEGNLSEQEARAGRLQIEQWYTDEMQTLLDTQNQAEADAQRERDANYEQAANERRAKDLAAIEAAKQAKEAERQAWLGSAMNIADLILPEKEAAKFKGAVEVAEAIRTGAQFIETMDPRMLLASTQHALAAKAYFTAAGSGSGAKGGGGGGGGGHNRKKDKSETLANTTVTVNFHGAVLDGAKLEQWMSNEFVPTLDRLSKGGRVTVSSGKKL